ncbi:phytoene/squalene synthase family protein [Shouchella sp. 1P09AA]|uniref:phytoene/squalene synthase family protein n=1 Tax=unclassified Shouchella TaxID=2893065 RepID=UPI0039A1CC98
MIDLDKAYTYCLSIMNQHSATFSKAFSFLPMEQRKAVWAVYAFCRRADDIADQEGYTDTQKSLLLDSFETEFDRMLRGDVQMKPEWVALRNVFQNFEMEEQHFKDQLKGQKLDVLHIRFQTLDDLENYSYHVASTVGLMLNPILAPGHYQQLETSAIALGKAMQLTNILRDVGEDLNRGRLYLPHDELATYQVNEAELRNGQVTPRFIALWEAMAKKAEQLYNESLEAVHLYPPESRFSVYGATVMYREILSAIREQQYEVFSQKVYVSEHRKQELLYAIHSLYN